MSQSSSPPFLTPGTGDPRAPGVVAGADGLPIKFGKYTLIRKLATGGMAELFLAIQRSVAGFEKLLVIKRILPAMNQDRGFIDMLLHEARIAATLSHPNIVQIFDVGQVDGQFFIAMEHVHGEDLRSIVRQMKRRGLLEFPLEHALAIALGMCAGLAYAHERRDLDGTDLHIVHRDISPQNVVVTFTGDVKIVDFGIAKSDGGIVEQTKSGKLKGKVPYMSPEQARGEELDARSDVFALSIILFELTTGRRLFKGQSDYETLRLICERDYPRPSDVVPDYPPDLEAIVMKGLAKDRAERYQSAREMQSDIEAFVRRHRIAVSSVALNQFMHGLFDEKLAAQKEALLQGKQLADIIEMQHALSAEADVDASGQRVLSTQSMPAAARTLTDLTAKKYRTWTGLGVFAILALAGAGAAAYFAFARPMPQPTVASAPMKGALKIVSDPPGASIWVNGDLRAETTPSTIEGLPLDTPLDVKLTKDDFETAKQDVKLSSASPVDLKFELKKGTVTIEVHVSPEGAIPTLFVDGKNVNGPRIDGITSGASHALLVTAPGYDDQTVTFNGAALETKRVEVTLEKTVAKSAFAPKPPPARVTTAPSAQGAQGSGKLNIGASGGWCNVSIDGVARGETPVAGVELSAGPHRVVCTTPDGKTQQATVNVTADGTTRFKFSL